MKRLVCTALAIAYLAALAAIVLQGNGGVQPPVSLGVSASSLQSSAWDEPALANPINVVVSATNYNLKLNQSQDYVLSCAPGLTTLPGKFSIWGGHNVVLQDCNLAMAWNGALCVYPHAQTGTFWIADVNCQAATGYQLDEGMDLSEPAGTAVVVRDVLFGSPSDYLQGSQSTNHADCIQTWSGPATLLVDGFTCYSDYQGLFLLPEQQGNVPLGDWDFTHVNLHLTGAYAFTFGSGLGYTASFHTYGLYVDGAGEPRLYPGGEGFEDVMAGMPSAGDYVTPTNYGTTGADDPGSGIDPAELLGEQQ